MLPDPLHPAVVHLPIALAMLLPMLALLAWVLRARKASSVHTWMPVVLVAAGLALSSWAAVETGEDQEEIVERVVPENALEEHEERAEIFLRAAVLVFLLVALGLLPGKAGLISRVLSAVGMAALLFLAYRVGHTGGELVYRHGAAEAYLGAPSGAAPGQGEEVEQEDPGSTDIEPQRRKRRGRDDD